MNVDEEIEGRNINDDEIVTVSFTGVVLLSFQPTR